MVAFFATWIVLLFMFGGNNHATQKVPPKIYITELGEPTFVTDNGVVFEPVKLASGEVVHRALATTTIKQVFSDIRIVEMDK